MADNGPDAIDELLRRGAARAEMDALLAGKTADEQQDALLGLALGAIGQLAAQNEALAGLVQKSARVIEALDRRVAALDRRVSRIEGNARGPFIRRNTEATDER